jgi:GNAT superfamily N-acetyltransferase
MDDPRIQPSTEADNARVGELLDAYTARTGHEFRHYDFHMERDGRVVAGIMAWALGPDVHIDTLAVDESARRQGLGSALLAHVEEAARRDGCTTASVDTFSHQAPEFYPRHGFEPVFRYPLDDGSERVYFSKRL